MSIHRPFALSVLALVALTQAAAPAAADDYRELKTAHRLTAEQALHINFEAGELEIEAGTGQQVEVELDVECKWRHSDCEEILDDIEMNWRSSDRRLYLEITGPTVWRRPRVEIEALIRMPKSAALSVEMAAGRLTIDGPEGDVRVDLGAGEFRLWMPQEAVDSVSVDVGVGDAKLRGRDEYLSGRRSMLIGAEVYWNDGTGKSLVDVEVGAGDATVWLD